jgi:rod shape-determining protein MreC
VENFFSRYRNASILVLVLLAQVLGLAVQVKRSGDAGGSRLLRVWVVSAVTPLERALVDSGQTVRSVWKNYIYLRGVRHENRDLKEQLDRMRIDEVRLNEDAAQARRLQTLLGFKEQFVSQTLAAQVIGSSGSDQSRVLYIDKGSNDGVRVDMAVITPDGIVGKVLRVFPISSQVLMINDASSGVGAILEKSRLQGILQGTASGETMLRYVMSDEKVEPGERIVTSGGDRIFPKGLPVGTVIQSNLGSDLFLNVRVKPAADLNRLEELLVVTRITDTTSATEEASGRIRAADILAQRLPSVPQKPANAGAPGTVASAAPANTATPNTATPNTASAPAAKPVAGGVNPASATATSPVARPTTAAGTGTNKLTTTAAAPASAPSNQPKTAAASPQAGGAAATPKAATNPPKPSPTPAPRIISDESTTASTKPAGAAPKSSATPTGDAAKKPAVVKPAAKTVAPGATDAAQQPKPSKSSEQPTKPATPAPPQAEEPSR